MNYIYTNAKYVDAEELTIQVHVDKKDGVDAIPMGVPKKVGNPYYDDMVKQSISIIAYDVAYVATMNDYRSIRDTEMDYVDLKKANSGKFDDFTGPQKASYKQWQKDMRDSTSDQAVIDGLALLTQDDIAGIKALMPTKPSILV